MTLLSSTYVDRNDVQQSFAACYLCVLVWLRDHVFSVFNSASMRASVCCWNYCFWNNLFAKYWSTSNETVDWNDWAKWNPSTRKAWLSIVMFVFWFAKVCPLKLKWCGHWLVSVLVLNQYCLLMLEFWFIKWDVRLSTHRKCNPSIERQRSLVSVVVLYHSNHSWTERWWHIDDHEETLDA